MSLFDVGEWDRLGELGFFGEDDRVELVEGEIVDTSPIGDWHASCVDKLARILDRQVGDTAIVRVHGPVRLSRHSEPLPDIALLKYRPDSYSSAKPGPEDVLLLVEVSDTTASYDLGTKAHLYACHGRAILRQLSAVEAGQGDLIRAGTATGRTWRSSTLRTLWEGGRGSGLGLGLYSGQRHCAGLGAGPVLDKAGEHEPGRSAARPVVGGPPLRNRTGVSDHSPIGSHSPCRRCGCPWSGHAK